MNRRSVPFYQQLKTVELPYMLLIGREPEIVIIETETQRKRWVRYYRQYPWASALSSFGSGATSEEIVEAHRAHFAQ